MCGGGSGSGTRDGAGTGTTLSANEALVELGVQTALSLLFSILRLGWDNNSKDQCDESAAVTCIQYPGVCRYAVYCTVFKYTTGCFCPGSVSQWQQLSSLL